MKHGWFSLESILIREDPCSSVAKNNHARKIAWLKFPLPSSALPASGSRGSIGISPRSSQPGGSPAVSRLSPATAKSTRREPDLREQSRQIRAMTPAEEFVPPAVKFSLASVMTNEMQIRQPSSTNLNPLLAQRIRPAAICFPGDNPQPALGAFYLPRPDSFRFQPQLPGQGLHANLSWQSIGFHHAPSGIRLR